MREASVAGPPVPVVALVASSGGLDALSDVLLRSLAAAGGPVIAVVVTGRGADGAAGTLLVHDGGGRVLAQDAATSRHYGMPGAGVDAGGVDESLPLDAIAPRVAALAESLFPRRS